MDSHFSKKTILFLSADPTDASRLRLGQELREIQERLSLSKLRDTLVLTQRMSVRPSDLTQAIFDTEPKIVHFAGHGTSNGELWLEDESGYAQAVSPEALAGLFELLADQVECVVLNACFSERQAKAIAQHIDYVIGMNKAIGDSAAIAFASGFYKAIAGGYSIEKAYSFGIVELKLLNIPEDLTPVLLKKPELKLHHFSMKPKITKTGDTSYLIKTRAYPDYASIDLPIASQYPESLTIYINPESYESINALLDDLFINYLSAFVKPYSYGQEWMLVGQSFRALYLAPWDWIHHVEKPIHNIDPNWAINTSLHEQEIHPSTDWKIEIYDNGSEEEFSDSGFYGVALNDEIIADTLLSNPKAIHLLYRDEYLHPCDLEQLNPQEYKFKYVFQDWLEIGLKGNILKSTGKKSEGIRRLSSGFAKLLKRDSSL
jgi:hypothetical protein